MSKEVKEPAVRMIKRDTISTAKAWGIRLAAVALSLIVAGLVIVAITKQNPIQVISWYYRQGAVGSSRRDVGNDPRDIGAFMYCDRTDTGI